MQVLELDQRTNFNTTTLHTSNTMPSAAQANVVQFSGPVNAQAYCRTKSNESVTDVQTSGVQNSPQKHAGHRKVTIEKTHHCRIAHVTAATGSKYLVHSCVPHALQPVAANRNRKGQSTTQQRQQQHAYPRVAITNQFLKKVRA